MQQFVERFRFTMAHEGAGGMVPVSQLIRSCHQPENIPRHINHRRLFHFRLPRCQANVPLIEIT